MAETVLMPKLGFDMAEGTLVRWVKNEGEEVKKGDVLAEIETDKATVEVESSFGGVVLRFLVEQGSSVPVGEPIAIIGAAGEKVSETEKVSSEVKKEENPSETKKTEEKAQPVSEQRVSQEGSSVMLKASPLAKKIARENKIELSAIKGSGPEGRIVRKDVENAMASPQARPVEFQKVGSAKAIVSSGEDKAVPIDKLRAIIGRRMVESKQQIPHFYVTHSYNVESLLRIRQEANEILPENERISVNDFVIKAAALTLRKFPNLNAAIHGDEIVQYGHINIGVAVSLDRGLMTVVCRDADQKLIRQISVEMKEQAGRARQGRVRPEDIEGSTFSISNMGMFDVENFAAIINSPEAAILAVSSAKEVPVVKNGMVTVGKQMKITISADHRITDGVEAARFMQEMALYLENPAGLLIVP